MLAAIKKNWVTVSIIVAMVLGVIFGLTFKTQAASIKFVGDIFFRLIQMCIIAFILCQITEAVGSLTKEELSKSGGLAIALFFFSSLLASGFGILIAYLFQPGIGFGGQDLAHATSNTLQDLSVQTLLIEFVPKNIFESLSNGTIIQVIVFALFFGSAITGYVARGHKSKWLDLIKEANELIMSILKSIMKLAPIGIFAYVSATIGSLGVEAVGALLKYMLIFLAATAIFMLLWLFVVSIGCKMNLIQLVKKMMPMSIMAIATTSSAITLPVEMDDAKHKLGLSDRIANLVLPLGMPLNSNGAAMYMSFTAIMIAQIYGIQFELPQLFFIAIVCVLLSLANAVVPGAGIVSLTMMVPQFGLPLESIAIFAGIDWIMGCMRTVLNVNSDVFCALLVARNEGEIDYTIFNS